MSYTVLKGQPQGSPRHFAERLREILIGELFAIRGYQEHIANSQMQDLNRVWHSIMLDEKKHYGWILKLLRLHDPEQNKAWREHAEAAQGPKDPMQAYRPAYDRQIILNNIRDDIKGELEAVILYEDEMLFFSQPDIRATLQAIINEEKGHAEHLTQMMLKYDQDAYDGLT